MKNDTMLFEEPKQKWLRTIRVSLPTTIGVFMKKIIAVCTLFMVMTISAFAQQITKFGVVDTSQVYTTYFRESMAVRNYEAKKAQFQSEINKLTEDLKKLAIRKAEYLEKNDKLNAEKIDAEITKASDYITEYSKVRNIELNSIKKRLETGDEFYAKLYDVINTIAESEGYSMILSLQQSGSILWYSPTVDITQKVIAALNR